MGDLSLLGRLWWWFTGEMADFIHRFDGPTDAVSLPLFVGLLAGAMLYIAHAEWFSAVSVVALGGAALFSLFTLLLAGAAIWYYVEPVSREVSY